MINPNYPHKNAKVKPKLENSWCVSHPYPPKTFSVWPCFLCLEALVEKLSNDAPKIETTIFFIFKNISRLSFDTIKRVFFLLNKRSRRVQINQPWQEFKKIFLRINVPITRS